MRVQAIVGCCFLLACGNGPQETNAVTTRTGQTTSAPVVVTTPVTDAATAPDTATKVVSVVPVIKRPSGVYRFLLPADNGKKILHTISFSAGTFRLQEEFPQKQDSAVITEGTWAPSSGYIWLYKDQLVRGRYTWQGDTLHYYSPRLKKSFAMEKLTSVRTNDIWQTKKAAGTLLYGIGTEPFWSVEVTGGDSVVLNMPDWNVPLRGKVNRTTVSADSTVYAAVNDSLLVTVYPYFCSDGMSDFLYTKRIKMVYKGQVYRGCGEKLRAAN